MRPKTGTIPGCFIAGKSGGMLAAPGLKA